MSWRTRACGGLLLVLTSAADGTSPAIRLATGGGDAWTFPKPITGRFSADACDSVLVQSPAGSVPAALAPRAVRVRLRGNELPGAVFDDGVQDLLSGVEVQIDSSRPALELDAHQAMILQHDPASR